MTRSFHLCFTVLAGAIALAAEAQEAPASSQSTPATPRIKIAARTNAGNLPYRLVFTDQHALESFLPARPRMIDVVWRIRFTEMTVPEQDAYVPQGWAVALVGDSVEQTVPVARGGYFLLPPLPYNLQGATVMIKEQSRANELGIGWIVRVGSAQRLTYAEFGRAMNEVWGAQRQIPVDYTNFMHVRANKYDGLKACFVGGSGDILIDGKPAADATVGTCSILKYDPAKIDSGQVIEFKGPLQVVTVSVISSYLTAKN